MQILHKPLRDYATLAFATLGSIGIFIAYTYPTHFPPWSTYFNDFSYATGILFITTIALLDKFIGLNTKTLVLALGIIAASVITLAYNSGANNLDLTIQFIIYALLAVIAMLVGQASRSSLLPSVIFGATLAAALISSVIGAIQASGLAKEIDPQSFVIFHGTGNVANGNLAQANNFGTLMVIGCWLAAFFHTRNREKNQPVLAILVHIGILALALGAYLSGSRTALLNLIIASAIYLAWWRWRKTEFSWLPFMPLLWYGIYYALVPALSNHSAPEKSLFHDPWRLKLWDLSISTISEAPWMGHGFRGLATSHLNVSPDVGSIGYTFAAHAHNSVLDLWITFGVIVGSVMAGAYGWLWLKAFKDSVTTSQFFVFLAITAISIHALLEYPLRYGFFLWPVFFMLGYLSNPASRRLRIPQWLPIAWLSLTLGMAFMFWRAYVEVEALYSMQRQEHQHEITEGLSKASLPAKTLYPSLLKIRYWLAIPLAEIQGNKSAQDVMLDELEGLARSYPMAGLLFRSAILNASLGNNEKAHWWNKRLCALYMPETCNTAASMWLTLGKGNPSWPVFLPAQ